MKIEIRVREITKKDGTTFLAYKGFTKQGWMDLKFRKEITNLPTKNSIIEVDEKDVNINFKGRFPVIWVSNLVHFEELSFERNVAEFFDTETR